jgi:hypothetical protein
MPKLGICFQGQRLFQILDPLRDVPQALRVTRWIATTRFVGDDGEPLSEGDCEVG